MKSEQSSTFGAAVTDSVDQMMRLPIRMTEGAIDAVMGGVRWMAGGVSHASADHMDAATYADTTRATVTTKEDAKDTNGSGVPKLAKPSLGDQDLRGDDLKYVVWSIVFTKPGFETVLEPQHEELVNYEADPNMYAATKIATFVTGAQAGNVARPEAWGEQGYPGETRSEDAEPQSTSFFGSSKHDDDKEEKGWGIPAEDQRYITFLYRVDRRLPRQKREVTTRVERVTIEEAGSGA